MQFSRKTLLITVFLLFAVVILIYFSSNIFLGGASTDGYPNGEQVNFQGSSINSDWKAYTNIEYGYLLSLPPTATVSKYMEEDPDPLNRTDYLRIFLKGTATEFFVKAYPSIDQANDSVPVGLRNLTALSLHDFAEAIRQNQIQDTNPNLSNRMVGGLKKITLAGTDAYSFTLTKGFTGPEGSYIIPADTTYNYVAVKNNSGVKLLIYYPLENTVAREIYESFILKGIKK